MDPEAVELLRMILLVAIQDRGDRVRIEFANEWYQVFIHINGEAWEMVPPMAEQVQPFPAVLASWERPWARLWHRATVCVRRWASGSQSGRFRFPVGAGSVSVEYRLRWRSRRVEDIDLTIRGADLVVVPTLVNPNEWDVDIPEE